MTISRTQVFSFLYHQFVFYCEFKAMISSMLFSLGEKIPFELDFIGVSGHIFLILCINMVLALLIVLDKSFYKLPIGLFPSFFAYQM